MLSMPLPDPSSNEAFVVCQALENAHHAMLAIINNYAISTLSIISHHFVGFGFWSLVRFLFS